MPGMRCLADLRCERCGAGFYGDLPTGQGLYTPMLLERRTGFVHDRYGTEWFAGWLRNSFANRTSEPIGFTVRETQAGAEKRRAVLLNCLDTLYGHSLLKLLNAQYYLDAHPDFDLLVMVPASLSWMVPAGARESWIVDLPLRRGTMWNEWLAGEVRRRVEAYDSCYLSLAFSHPSSSDFSIERFTKTKPFPHDEWEQRLTRPTVTFIWRDDRLWSDSAATQLERAGRAARFATRFSARWQRRQDEHREHAAQRSRVLELAVELRRVFAEIDFSVAGIGAPGNLPSWITDERCTGIDEATEQRWCERYASSHVVIGVHGSNMLLPSAHAGATVELVPPDRWGNVLQDLVVPPCNDGDARATMFRQRLLPLSTSPQETARVVASILSLDRGMRLLMTQRFCQHGDPKDASRWRFPRRDIPQENTSRKSISSEQVK